MSDLAGDPPLPPDPAAIRPPSPAPTSPEPLAPPDASARRAAAGPRAAATAPLTPSAPPPRPTPDPTVPSARRLIGASFDLLSSASDEMRRASFYIGAIVAGTAGGYAIATWLIEVAGVHSTTAEIERALSGALGGWMGLLGLLAGIGIFVASVESRAMAAALLGGRISGRPDRRPGGPRQVALDVLAGGHRLDHRGHPGRGRPGHRHAGHRRARSRTPRSWPSASSPSSRRWSGRRSRIS